MKKLLEFIDKNPRLPKFVKDNKDLLLKAAAVILVMVLAFAVFVLNESEDETAQIQEKDELEISDSKSIFIDVGGEVKKPTVVELSDGSRVADAIEAAGGITDKADLTDINRAAFVSDGEKITQGPNPGGKQRAGRCGRTVQAAPFSCSNLFGRGICPAVHF